MTDLLGDDDEASTPLTPEERAELIPSYITLRRELNEAEQANITDADQWAFSRKRDVLDAAFLLGLHRRMLGRVWRWAGRIRTTGRNIGVEPNRIEVELHQLLGDVRFWVEHASWSPDEIAVRFHHRLVAIHPFANGNGRHARLAADLLAIRLGVPRFSWGGADLAASASTVRARYVDALRAADRYDIGPLLAFARS